MNEQEVVTEQTEEQNIAQEKPEMPQHRHRRPGPGMPPPPKGDQKGCGRPGDMRKPMNKNEEAEEGAESDEGEKKSFRKCPENNENGSRRPPKDFGKGYGRPCFGRPGEKRAEETEESSEN